MKKIIILLFVYFSTWFKAFAEFEIDFTQNFSSPSETIKLTNQGIIMGEYGFNSTSQPFNGIYFDDSGNLNFRSKILNSYKITDIDEDENNYYATSYMVINNKQGLFKISKDFQIIENIGIKAAMRKVHQYKDKVYYGGYTHGCYVINKDGTGLTQILGDGYFGPFVDDIKSNSKNIYVLSRGLLYKVDYSTNQKEQLIFGLRPSFIEVDEEKIYFTASNKFYYLSFDNKTSNEKIFPSNIVFLKKFKNLIIIAENDNTNINFWFSNDNGKNFYKSLTKLPSSKTIRDIEITGDKIYTLYLNLANQGVVKGKLIFDFQDKKIFNPPFQISKDSDLKDKITSFFDHRYPYLGNLSEPDEYKNTTLNFHGKDLAEPYIYYSSHDGIDWGLPLNTPIYSSYEGVASYFYQENGLGHAIMISHPNGYLTIYGHLSNEDLITSSNPIYASSKQKIGKVGMSGRTSGPHLHFTTYFGPKELKNKIDPFGWEAKSADPWEQIGSKSYYLWNNKTKPVSVQFNPNTQPKIIQKDKLSLEIANLSFLKYPMSLEIENVSPIYNSKNYIYFQNSSYLINSFDLSSLTIPQPVLGIISYQGFKSGDDKYYSIWRLSEEKVEKQATIFNTVNNSLSTLFEPNSQFLILKDNYKKISVKTRANITQ